MNSKNGGTMVMVMVVMMALAIISVGLFKLVERNAIETVHETQASQAFWVVESGLQQTLEKILTDKYYRNSISADKDFPNDPDDAGPYEVEIDGVGRAGKYSVELYREGRDYNITVKGDVGGIPRCLNTVAANVQPDLAYAVMVLDGTADIQKDSKIDGKLHDWGLIKLAQGVSVSGEIYAKAMSGNDYDYTELTEQADVTFKQNYYNAELALAKKTTSSGGEKGRSAKRGRSGKRGRGDRREREERKGGKKNPGSSGDDVKENINLDGKTRYINGDVKIQSLISGPGMLVVDGDITFEKNYSIDDEVKIILSGDVNAKKSGSFGTNMLIFAKGKMKLGKSTMSRQGSSTLMAIGDITIDKNLGSDDDEDEDDDYHDHHGKNPKHDDDDHDRYGKKSKSDDHDDDHDEGHDHHGKNPKSDDDDDNDGDDGGDDGGSTGPSGFTGLIYSGGNINLKASVNIIGSVICKGNFDMAKDSVITYDPSVISIDLLEDYFVVDRYSSNNTWNELPPQ